MKTQNIGFKNTTKKQVYFGITPTQKELAEKIYKANDLIDQIKVLDKEQKILDIRRSIQNMKIMKMFNKLRKVAKKAEKIKL